MSITGIFEGGVFAAALYFADGLQPVKWPDACGERRVLALGQYAMIASFVVATVMAIAYTILGSATYAAMAMIAMPITVLGAYGLQRAILQASIQESTASLEASNARLKAEVGAYKTQIDRLAGEVQQLGGQIKDFQKVNEDRAKLIADQTKARLKYEADLKEAKAQNALLAQKVDELKGIPTQLSIQVNELAGQINTYVQSAASVDEALKTKAQANAQAVANTAANLNTALDAFIKGNNELSDNMASLNKLTKSFAQIINTMIDLHKQTVKAMDDFKESIKNWKADELIKALNDVSGKLGKDADDIASVITTAQKQTQDIDANAQKLADLQKKWEAMKKK